MIDKIIQENEGKKFIIYDKHGNLFLGKVETWGEQYIKIEQDNKDKISFVRKDAIDTIDIQSDNGLKNNPYGR